MAKVIWRGPEREFPGLGRIVQAGDAVELPDEQAAALIAAGYAEPEQTAPKRAPDGKDGER